MSGMLQQRPSVPRCMAILGPVLSGQTVIAVAVIALLYFLGHVVGQSQSVQWGQIRHYLFDPTILQGVRLSLMLTVGAMVFGIGLGSVVAAMAISRIVVLKMLSALFVWLFRGVPLIVQIFFWFNIALFVPQLSFGTMTLSMNTIVTPALAGFLALGLHEAANMAEVIRGGLQSVNRGQNEAAASLGLTPTQTLRFIIMPQAARIIIPPTGNQTIGMLKASAIVSVIGMNDLLTQAQHIYAQNFLVIELLIVASLWYLAITTLASIAQYFLEQHILQKRGSASGFFAKFRWGR